ncbi:hypothetical protein [Patulibacter sp.]|uniref:hypothetical protein n=1 Tax=Patulibacter sp. TaxID=1912859 RepID=UPI002715E76C|nr:hypothetical protein [Patulibacter sp.]MDO9407515.1 hypothetical protein [Patulibacter sp.]
MRRALPPLVLLATLAVAAPSGAATSPEPRPAKGRAVVVATAPRTSYAVFAANKPVDLNVVYHRRSSSAAVRLAVRPGADSCPSRPRAADRRRGGVGGSSSSGRAYVATAIRIRARVGVNRVCVWAKEGSGSFRRRVVVRETFARNLFAATTAQGSQGDLAIAAATVLSSSPLSGTLTQQTLGGGSPCGVESRPLQPYRIGVIQRATYSVGTGSVCTGLAVQAASGPSSASLAVGTVPVGAPAAVVGHVGDCDAEILKSVPVPRAAVPAFVAAAGCRLGRVLDGSDETRRRGGRPATGNAYLAVYRGRTVDVAPKGTRIDVLIDAR